MSGPLAGIRVIDLSTVVMGPYATQMLGDLGAEVVKIEPPEGDTTRQVGQARHPGMGAVFLALGRNKRSVVLDLKRPAALAALLRLLDGADVLLHNMRPEATRRLGLAYEEIAASYPRLVYCAARGFASNGPYRDRPAYDDMIQGASGTAAIMAGLFGAPSYVPMIYADKVAGLYVANAILAALLHRAASGRGQEVEVPMFESVAAFNLVEHLGDAIFADAPGAPGYARALSPQRRPFPTRDGHVCALPYTDRHFRRFFTAFGRPDLAEDPRFAGMASRLRHIDAVYGEVAVLIAGYDTATCLRKLEEAEIPAHRVNALRDLFEDAHLVATGFFARQEHPTEGPLRQPGVPMRFAATPAAIRQPAPRLGQHTEEVLREAGLTQAEIAEATG